MRRTLFLLLALGLGAVGCKRQDAEHLSRIGHYSLDQLEGMAGGSQGKLASAWQGLRASLDRSAIESRSQLRLGWDRTLEGSAVTLSSPSAGVVEVQGTVTGPAQQRRVLDLVRSTLGVEKVIDRLQIEEKAIP